MNIGYIRVSTDSQENSVLTQKEMISNYSKLKGIEIDDYFVDFGISGKNTIKREKINISLSAIYNKNMGLQTAKRDLIWYNYSDYFHLNGKTCDGCVGYLASYNKNIMQEGESMKQDEVEGSLGYKVSYTMGKNSFTIPKDKTIIKGTYVN